MGRTVIAIGVDPALGGGFAQVVADLGDELRILDALTVYDLSKTEEQIELIQQMVSRYRPSMVVIEFDSQQKGLGNDDRLKALGDRYGFSIRPHITRGQKMDAVFGVASMDQSFKLGKIRIPYGDDITKERMAPLISQLRAWRPDIKSKNLVQDLTMALWFLWRFWMQTQKKHDVPPIAAFRPSWLIDERAYRGARIA
jgi:hypothetical protein